MTKIIRIRVFESQKSRAVIRNVGLVLGAVGTTILTAGTALPVVVTTAAGYMITVGAVAAAVSQTTVDWKKYERQRFVGL